MTWLPPLLLKRKEQYKIPDVAFGGQFVFDRVGVWQIEAQDKDADKYEGTSIIKPVMVRDAEERGEPRGVIISAGAQALDCLTSHGMDLGHIVWFVRLSPWRRQVGLVDGRPQDVLILRVGDIVASEDLAKETQQAAIYERMDGLFRYRKASRIDPDNGASEV